MVGLRAIAVLLLLSTLLPAQSKAVKLAVQCSAEMIQAQSLPCSYDEPCPLFLELADVDQAATRIVLTGNVHTGSATIESILLISDDGGRTWNEAHQRIPSAVLDQIQFYDFETGWINGHILQTSPKDAFFLLTTDGGESWRRRPVTSDSRTGAVEHFWFDSRTHGMLSLDRVRAVENGFRYELWESQTGGESWSVRQVDAKPVTLNKPALPEPTLRIKTDRDGKTHRLERKEASKWIPVAAFAVSLGECRPPAEADKEPPPEPQAEPASSPAPTPSSRKPPTLRTRPGDK